MLFPADYHPLVGAADLNHIERRAGGYAESLALANREIVNAVVRTDNFAIGCYQIAGGVGQRFTLIGEISVNEALVVAAGDETDFLRVGLPRQRKAVLARKVADLGLGHVAERKQGAA